MKKEQTGQSVAVPQPELPAQVAETKQPQATPAPQPTQPDITHRLTEEFAALRREFPELKSPEQLPPEVLEAAQGQAPLLDAYLRFRWQEEKRVRAEAARRQAAAESAVGSLLQGGEPVQPEQDAFLSAFRRALR